MLRKIILLLVIAAVHCQYPEQRAPPPGRYRPPPEEYEEEYEPAPRRAPAPQPAYISNPRPQPVTHKPASVHYVNIGLELAGDYKFGYDTGKGNDGQSFREETRLPDGSVQGAYGYVDETGTQRIVKYTAGKEGFKVLGEGSDGASAGGAPRQSQPAPAPQQAYRPPPPAQPAPQPAPRPQPQPQPAYRAPPPQPAYRPPPQQPAYRPQPQPRPAYRAPQPEYAPEPRPRPQPRPRPAPRPVQPYDEEPDYDYPNNEIGERRLVPVDTSLFNYNIGTSPNAKI